jgi:hypothetical protein
VETGSRQENASNQESKAPFRFNRNGKGSSRAPRQRERYSKAGDEKPGALPQTLNEPWSALEMSARRRGRDDHNRVSVRVERNRDQPQRHELKRRVRGCRVQKLWNERQEERRGLGIERLDHNAFPKRSRGPAGAYLFRRQLAGFAEGPDAKPDQIERADQLQSGEELRARKNDRRDAKAACDSCTSPPSAVPRMDAIPGFLPPDNVRAAT